MPRARKLICLILTGLFLLGLACPALAAGDGAGEITVIYTNDTHTYIDGALSFASAAALKREYAQSGDVLLVDAGDHAQGTAYGAMDSGKSIIEIMNAAGYDAATPGNHEFDYGMDGFEDIVSWAEYPYLSCNFYHEQGGERGENVLESYRIFELGGKKVAVIGVTTPDTITSSTPAYFMDEAQSGYIYGISAGLDGEELYADVQAAIDSAEAAGADYIIALGHLGIDPSSSPYTSEEVIAATEGLDAFIDGHSHSTVPMREVSDKNGETVVLTQTGSYFGAVGVMTISADGDISTELVTEYEGTDEAVKALQDTWITSVDAQLGEVIGTTDCVLDNYDETGARLVRRMETNTGDFTTDALYYVFDSMGLVVDAAIMNGGGIRNTAVTGEISYKTCKEIHTFGNVACLITVTGQQLLDALEWGVRELSSEVVVESGAFMQVSGLKYDVDVSIPSTVQEDDKGVWTGGPTGEYRVSNVQVLSRQTGEYEPLELDAEYNLAGYNYTLRNLGDGYAMFAGAEAVLDYVMEDYMVLASYVQSFPVDAETGLPCVTGYDSVYGTGRINVYGAAEPGQAESGETESAPGGVYVVQPGDSLWEIAEMLLGDGQRWDEIFELNRGTIKQPELIYIGQSLELPAA